MSYEIGIDTLHLRPTPRLAHTEYCSNERLMHLVEKETGQRFENAWELDMLWNTDDGPVPWSARGRTTDMGHAEFLEGGVDRRAARPSPFTSVEEVWAFDAAGEYGMPDSADLTAYYEGIHREGQRANPEQVFTGGYYKTMVSGAIEAFGWDMLLSAAADHGRFERVLDSFFRLSLHHFRAWAQTGAEVFICHDDMVWTEGPFMNPVFYRHAIFPRYAALWRELKHAGKRVLFCSDGNWTMFLDDIAAAGADGFIFEPLVNLATVVERYGASHVIVGSKVDCRTLTFGTMDDVRREIDATMALAYQCPGFMFAVGNHIPSNVPVEHGQFYFEHLRSRWAR